MSETYRVIVQNKPEIRELAFACSLTRLERWPCR